MAELVLSVGLLRLTQFGATVVVVVQWEASLGKYDFYWLWVTLVLLSPLQGLWNGQAWSDRGKR